MTGHWTGTYTGMNKNLTVKTNLDTIPFDFYVESLAQNEFTGFIEDHVFRLNDKFGMHGIIKGDRIEFKKYKTVNQGACNDFETKEMDKNGLIILYYGKFNQDRTEVVGKWKSKLKIVFVHGFIPKPYRGSKGTWSMKYIAEQ